MRHSIRLTWITCKKPEEKIRTPRSTCSCDVNPRYCTLFMSMVHRLSPHGGPCMQTNTKPTWYVLLFVRIMVLFLPELAAFICSVAIPAIPEANFLNTPGDWAGLFGYRDCFQEWLLRSLFCPVGEQFQSRIGEHQGLDE